MIKWLHQLFNPHCQHCADERREQRELLREDKRCLACETMERENARLVRENERLLDLLLEKDEPVVEKAIDVRELKPIQTTRAPFVPTQVRRQLLENESRHSAKLKQEAPKPEPTIKVDQELKDLEKELDDVQREREGQTKVG